MSVNFRSSKKSTLSGLTIKDCWGDCIYVGGCSQNITIDSCILIHGRRQGVSVTKANGVIIKNCKISDVGGSIPDTPLILNQIKTVWWIMCLLKNVTVDNCEGGLITSKGTRKVETKWIGTIMVRNCTVSSLARTPVMMNVC